MPAEVHSGYLSKRGEIGNLWKKRFFSLCDDGLLVYYTKQDKKTSKGCFNVAGGNLNFDEQGKDLTIAVQPAGVARIYLLRAESLAVRDQWLEKIQEVAINIKSQLRKKTIDEVKKAVAKNTSVVYTGTLSKRGEKGLNKAWRSRWFTLTGDGTMAYYDNEKNKQQKGAFNVNSAQLLLDEPNRLFGIKPVDQKRVYLMQANADTYKVWITHLTKRGANKELKSLVTVTGGKETRQPICAGWLNKRGDKGMKNYKERFFALYEDCTLAYYVDEKVNNKKGEINIKNADLVTTNGCDSPDIQLILCIRPAGTERIYVLQTDNEETKVNWALALCAHGATEQKRCIGEFYPWITSKGGMAVAPGNLVCSGWLSKRGDLGLRTWKRRFFAMYDEGSLNYYAEENMTALKGGLRVPGSTLVVQPEDFCALMFGIRPEGQDRLYLLEGDTESDARAWQQVLCGNGAKKVKGILMTNDEDDYAGGAEQNVYSPETEIAVEELPNGWEIRWMGNQEYYYNTNTGVSSWVIPEDVQQVIDAAYQEKISLQRMGSMNLDMMMHAQKALDDANPDASKTHGSVSGMTSVAEMGKVGAVAGARKSNSVEEHLSNTHLDDVEDQEEDSDDGLDADGHRLSQNPLSSRNSSRHF